MEIEADFVNDVRIKLAADLVQLGYSVPVPAGDAYAAAHRVCVDHYNAHARRVPTRSRVVHRSTELRARELELTPEIRAGVAAAESELTAGADLTPRLSSKLLKRGFNDKMLNDWGIHHLHLGLSMKPDDRFVTRTGDVLFVLFRDDDAYLIDVRKHGAWCDDDLVEIVHTNWPETIRQFRLDGVSGFEMTTEQRANLRSKNANAGVTTQDGTFYAGIGGGLVGSAANLRAVRWGDWQLMTARDAEAALRAYDLESLADKVAEEVGTRPARLTCRLAEIEGSDAYVVIDGAEFSVDGTARPFVVRIAVGAPRP